MLRVGKLQHQHVCHNRARLHPQLSHLNQRHVHSDCHEVSNIRRQGSSSNNGAAHVAAQHVLRVKCVSKHATNFCSDEYNATTFASPSLLASLKHRQFAACSCRLPAGCVESLMCRTCSLWKNSLSHRGLAQLGFWPILTNSCLKRMAALNVASCLIPCCLT